MHIYNNHLDLIILLFTTLLSTCSCFNAQSLLTPTPPKIKHLFSTTISSPNNRVNISKKNKNHKIKFSRLSKQLQACGRNHQKTLQVLYGAYPYLNQTSLHNDIYSIDGKCISSALGILGRADQFQSVTILLDRCVDIYIQNKYSRPSLNNDQFDQQNDDRMILMCFKAAISTFGLWNNWQKCLDILHHEIPTKLGIAPTVDLYHVAIAAMGKNQQIEHALNLLHELESNSSPPMQDRMAYHATLTALQRIKHTTHTNINVTHEILQILHHRMPQHNITTIHMTYNIAIMACAKANECSTAIQLLHDLVSIPHLKQEKPFPDDSIYHTVISSCGRVGRWEDAAVLTAQMKQTQNGSRNISQLPSKHRNTNIDINSNMTSYFDFLNVFPQVGKGKLSWWELGRWYQDEATMNAEDARLSQFINQDHSNNSNVQTKAISIPTCIRFGIQPHRNPVHNGITLFFYDAQTSEKIGFLLIRNKLVNHDPTQSPQFISALYGMKILEQYRGLGLSSLFLSIWLQLCLDMNPSNDNHHAVAIPQTEIINKPLIAFVLQNRFGFQPISGSTNKSSGVDVKLIPLSNLNTPELRPLLDTYLQNQLDNATSEPKMVSSSGRSLRNPWMDPKFALVSPSRKPLEGAFSERDLRIQGMTILPRHIYTTYKKIQKKDDPHSNNNKEEPIFCVKASLEHPAFSSLGTNYDVQTQEMMKLKDQITIALRRKTNDDIKEQNIHKSQARKRADIRYLSDKKALTQAFFGYF